MKPFTLPLTLAALLAASSAFASQPTDTSGMQPPQQRQQRPDLDELTQQLGLTSEQANKLKALMEQHRQERDAMRQDDQQHDEDAMQQRHTQRDRHREELLTVLSYEQLYKFERYMEQHRPRPGFPGAGMPRPEPQ